MISDWLDIYGNDVGAFRMDLIEIGVLQLHVLIASTRCLQTTIRDQDSFSCLAFSTSGNSQSFDVFTPCETRMPNQMYTSKRF